MSDNQPLRFAEDGNPFASEEAAKEVRRRLELDARQHSTVKVPNGWAIQDNAAAAMALMRANTQAAVVEDKPARYFEVEFTQTSDPNATPYVPLILNGWELRLQRGVPLILPEPFVEIARNAIRTRWAKPKDGGQALRADGVIQAFPFRILRGPKGEDRSRGEQADGVNEQDFKAQLQSGNAITNDFIERLRKAVPAG